MDSNLCLGCAKEVSGADRLITSACTRTKCGFSTSRSYLAGEAWISDSPCSCPMRATKSTEARAYLARRLFTLRGYRSGQNYSTRLAWLNPSLMVNCEPKGVPGSSSSTSRLSALESSKRFDIHPQGRANLNSAIPHHPTLDKDATVH
jgi:hypothetical protein